MFSQKCNNFVHFYLLGPYYVIEDHITARRNRNLELGNHDGEVAVITGGHRGIGAMITKDLMKTGMHIIMGCRNIKQGQRFVGDLRTQGITTGEVTILPLDLASLNSVRIFAEEVLKKTSKINYIINNAGIILTEYTETEDHVESQWQVNYLSHFLLCHLLLPTLQDSEGPTKIISTSSLEHKTALSLDLENLNKKEKFDGQTGYARSKLAQIMFSLYLNDRLNAIGSKVVVLAAHPGIVNTEAFDGTMLKKYFPFVPRLFFKTPEQGAKPIVYAALEGKGGEYIGNCTPQTTSSLSKNKAEQDKLFEESKKILQITAYGQLF